MEHGAWSIEQGATLRLMSGPGAFRSRLRSATPARAVFAEASVFALRATTRQVRLRLRLQATPPASGYALRATTRQADPTRRRAKALLLDG
jgi:hypothetical protein